MILILLLAVAIVVTQTLQSFYHDDTLNSKELLESDTASVVCKFDIKQKSSGKYPTVDSALQQPCINKGDYEITLIDSEHHEHLELKNSQTILIKGKNKHQTIWTVNQLVNEIIYIIQCNLTLENIQFQFSLFTTLNLTISPQYYLINAQSIDQQSQITIKKCIYKSISGQIEGLAYHILAFNASRVEIDNSQFVGNGLNDPTNISFIYFEQCNQTIINNCLFSNISVLSDQEPVQISTDVDNAYILIRDCQFSNFYSENDDCMAVLQLSSGVQHKVEVVQNSFINCKTNSSLSGAIRIYDFVLDQDNPSQYIIINNTFFNNTGKYSGSIELYTRSIYSTFQFNNNKFSNNTNTLSSLLGQDAYLVFVQPPTNWTSETINSIITAMFNGSKSDGRNGSVYYEIYFDTIMDLYGNITLPLLVIEPQKRKTSVLLVFCIIIGVIIGITALAGAIILAILFYQKRQSLFDPSGQMSQSLLTHNGIINESSNH